MKNIYEPKTKKKRKLADLLRRLAKMKKQTNFTKELKKKKIFKF